MKIRRAGAVIAAAATTLGLGLVSIPAQAAAVPAVCAAAADGARAIGSLGPDVAAGTVTILGQTTPIDLPTLDLASSPFPEPTRAMWWRDLAWFAALYLPSVQPLPAAGSTDPIGDLVAALDRYPDPGSDTPEHLALARSTGWDEGTNFQRERNLNCLYALTADERLRTALLAAAAVNKDPVRYYGGPKFRAHNHGLQANLALVDTANLLGDAEMRAFAVRRLAADAVTAFSPVGFTDEQSSDYHDVNVTNWTAAAAAMAASADTPVTATSLIRARLVAARAMSAALIDPTGHRAAIGDSRWVTGPRPAAQRALFLRDDIGGIATGRWSWTDTRTSWWTVRYGRAATMHGHLDHGSVTWSTLGVPVLVDPGFHSYDTTDPFMAWGRSAPAHNVAVPTSNPPVRVVSTMTSLVRTGRVDRFVVQNKSWTRPATVTGVVDDAHRTLTLTTTVASRFTTHLHLAPGWRLWSHRGLTWTFVTATRVLRITPATTPFAARVLTGSTTPVGGWVFTAFRTKVAAPELLVSSAARTQTLAFVVTVR